MKTGVAVLVGVVLSVTPVLAQPALSTTQGQLALHDKEWYVQNQAARAATLQKCYSDESFAHLPDCRNAADGERLVFARQHLAANDFLADPAWWDNNAVARRGGARICSQGTGLAYLQYRPYCSLIIASEVRARGT